MIRQLVLLSLLTMCTVGLHAEGVSVGPGGVKLQGFGDVDLEASLERWSSDEAERLNTLLELRVALVQQECDLTEAQTTKLRLLVKGMVSRHIAGGAEHLHNFMRASELVPDQDTEEKTPDPKYELLITGARKDAEVPGVVLFRTRFKTALFENSLWHGVLQSSLSAEQYAIYEQVTQERNQRFVQVALVHALAKLDDLVCLTAEQRANITDAWRREADPQITLGFPTNVAEATSLIAPTVADHALIREILTDKQWTALTVEQSRDQWRGVGWSTR